MPGGKEEERKKNEIARYFCGTIIFKVAKPEEVEHASRDSLIMQLFLHHFAPPDIQPYVLP